ncbi:hypothetical protein [Erwinia amylovora]
MVRRLSGHRPVSYTHLDVYKRQLMQRCCAATGKNDRPICKTKLIHMASCQEKWSGD